MMERIDDIDVKFEKSERELMIERKFRDLAPLPIFLPFIPERYRAFFAARFPIMSISTEEEFNSVASMSTEDFVRLASQISKGETDE